MMKWQKWITLKLLYYVTIKIGSIHGQTAKDECMDALDVQTNDVQFLNDWTEIYNKIPQHVSQAYNTMFPIRDYTKPYTSGRNIPTVAIEEACHDMDYDICAVSTTVSFNKTSTVIQEISKPVCFPQSCSEFEIDILDPEPISCRKEDGCEILDRNVVCPTRGFYPNGRPGNCTIDAEEVLTNEEIMEQREALEGRMTLECLKPLYGDESSWCSLHTINEINTSDKISSTAHNVIMDYTARMGGTFERLVIACTTYGYDLCTVDIETRVNDIVLFEKGKPICIPSSCDESSIGELDPYPACDSRDCEIVSTNIECPMIYAGLGSTGGSCESDIENVMSDKTILSSSKTFSSGLNNECKNILTGGTSKECTVIVPIVADVAVGDINISNITSIVPYENSCARVGGRPCQITGRTSLEMKELESIMDITTHFTEVPICVPNTCPDVLMKRAADRLLFNCMDSDLCKVSRFQYTCTIMEPSPVPSYQPSGTASNFPSMVASVEPTNTHSIAPSAAPTDIASAVPTNAPSVVLSFFPTGLYFTDMPSIFPSVKSSNMPSNLPTVVSTQEPTNEPSKIITIIPSQKVTEAVVDPTADISSGSAKGFRIFYKFMTILCFIVFIV